MIVIKTALKRSCSSQTLLLIMSGIRPTKRKTTGGHSYKSVCLTPSWVNAKAVKVAAETSSNSYDIKNKTDVYPVRCSVTDSEKPPQRETLPGAVSFCQQGQSQVVPKFIKMILVIQKNDASIKRERDRER